MSVRLCSESRLIQQHLPGQGEGSNGRKRAYAGEENVRESLKWPMRGDSLQQMQACRGIEPDTKRTLERGASTAGLTKLERTLHGTISSGNSMRSLSSLE